MDTQFQDLQWIIDRAKKEFRSKPTREIAPLFRDLRTNKKYSLFGDYFILWAMAEALIQLKRNPSRDTFTRAARYSDEFRLSSKRDKIMWLDNICRTWKKKPFTQSK